MNDRDPMNLPSRKLAWVLRVLSLVALALSSYLAWSAYQQSEVFGCGGGAVWDCGHVLHSRWSKWLGMPVSVPAMGMYLLVLIALAICGTNANDSTKHVAWAIITVGCLSAGIAATWFISLQAFVLKKLCIYCMCAHGCGLVLSALILWRRPLGKKMTSALSGLSVLGACALIAGQVLTAPPKTYAEERYDDIDFSANDGEVFAIESLETAPDSDEFLIAPIEEMLPPEDLSKAEGSALHLPANPSIDATALREATELRDATAPRESALRANSAVANETEDDTSLANFVSKYSIQLAEEIRKQLRDNVLETGADNDPYDADEVDDLSLSSNVAPIREIDGLQFESIPKENASDVNKAVIRNESAVQAAPPVQDAMHVNPYVTAQQPRSNELAKGLAEIAQDLADLRQDTRPARQIVKTEAGIAETKSIAVGRESIGVRKTPPSAPQPRRYMPVKPHQFARDASILVHDVPRLIANSNSTPTPTTSPIPNDGEVVTTAKADTKKKPQRNLVAVLGGRAKLDARHWPLIGDTNAKYVLVELFDYTCPHCRKMNQHIQAARERYGDTLSIMTLPVPLSQECNDTVSTTKVRHQAACELARLSVAVWRINSQAYESFHEWLFIPEHGRTTGEAWSYAGQLVGNDVLRKEMAKPTVSQFINKHVELYKRAGQGTVPKLMFPKVTIRGEMNSPDALYSVLERELFSSK